MLSKKDAATDQELAGAHLILKDADGKTNMVHYQSSGDYIIMATVPYAEVYRVRNIVVGWVIGGGIGILAVTCLALRMELLRQDAKNAKK